MPLSYTHPLLNQGNINIFSNFGQFLRVPYQKDKNKTIAKTSLSYMSLSIIGLYVMNLYVIALQLKFPRWCLWMNLNVEVGLPYNKRDFFFVFLLLLLFIFACLGGAVVE